MMLLSVVPMIRQSPPVTVPLAVVVPFCTKLMLLTDQTLFCGRLSGTNRIMETMRIAVKAKTASPSFLPRLLTCHLSITSKRIKKKASSGFLNANPVVRSPEQTSETPTAKRTKVDNSAEETSLGVGVGLFWYGVGVSLGL